MTFLKGHTTAETAYVGDDYPYGFRLRCKIRYWLEYNKKHGFRLVSQTTNPKVTGEVWNKPKASTYVKIAACMYLDDHNHVQWVGLSEYSSYEGAVDFFKKYEEGMSDEAVKCARVWIAMKKAYKSGESGEKA